MNYMKDVALMLGLEWDEEKQCSEEFKLKHNTFYDYNIIFQLKIYQESSGSGYGVEWHREGSSYTGSCADLIRRLIVGRVEIQKLPWRPKHREECWLAMPFDYREKARLTNYYEDKKYCRHNLKLDLYRKTEAEAIARTDEILRLLGVDAYGETND